MKEIKKIRTELEKNGIKVPKQITTRKGIIRYLEGQLKVYKVKLERDKNEYETTKEIIELLEQCIKKLKEGDVNEETS